MVLFQVSQKNWSTLTKEACVICMSFCKMVFYLKDAHVMIRWNYASLCKFIYSVTKNDKVNNWSQEIHSITPYIEFKCIKGKENVLADSLLGLKSLGLYEDNDSEKLGHEYGKSSFDSDLQSVCYVDTGHNAIKDLKLKVSNNILIRKT